MRQRTNIALSPGDKITAGPGMDGIWIRIEGRGDSTLLNLNEYQVLDLINELKSYAKERTTS